ncbi:ribosomal protein S18 acetylase RimI-like enzyme [Palleronia aestuarii]|uniref:Ribosomal protein S18 acetylase RimI-like enzyme n=1 Tax=Palleronia aestuarii TaxID=568105 RepID=A0A2W7Q1L7_9RHOB|nr:GNAT family N-acetyltransferase [Palleronia aestuarii]PZX15719.1 ribosomal protein S18 acetylase RimI-like enzyme [Palleronia aestuarii]
MDCDPALRIRVLDEADVQAYRAFHLIALSEAPTSFGSTYEVEAERSEEELRERLRTNCVFAAFDDRCIVGMIVFAQGEGGKLRHRGIVSGFYVDPTRQGLGIGGSLLDALIAEARHRVEQLVLIVTGGNQSAIGLYEARGFERCGIEPRALKHEGAYYDGVMMVRFLT